MTEILLLAIVIILALVAGFLIFVLLSAKNTFRELSKLLSTMESTIKPTMDELTITMKSLKEMTDNINTITDDVKKFSNSIGDLGENIKVINEVIGDIPLKISGVRAGIRVALEFLLKKLFKGGSK